MFLPEGTTIAHYRVERLLGRGGMAVVYEATDVALDRRVALKLLDGALGDDPGFVERFRREGRLQASLEHESVVTVYEAGESDHGLFLALRLVRGPTLAALLLDGVLDVERSLALLAPVATALDDAHAAGLVHRDVKPKNVLVGPGDRAYLADFGLTRPGGASALTATGELVGTLAYLAPEVIRGEPATPAADRYAFAAMLFECLSGSVVFPRASQAAVLFAHAGDPPPRITARRPELPPALDAVFARALAKEPGERPPSAGALIAETRAALAGTGPEALGPPPPPADATVTAVAAPRRRRRVALLVVAALATGAAAALLLQGGDAPSAPRPAPIPPGPEGARVLGSDLAAAGAPRDCRGGAVGPASPACTIVQTGPAVPETGVVRRWGVRSARGELALAVLRRRGDGAFQVARTRTEFVSDPGIHVFDADLAVERGDLVGLVALTGSAIGLGAAGKSTQRWIPELTGARRPPSGAGPARELLLRVDYVPGGRRTVPEQVKGTAAAGLAPGRERGRRALRFRDGRPAELAVVETGGRCALDLFRGHRRMARLFLPGFRPGGRLLELEAAAEPSEPEQLNVSLQYVNRESTRILVHDVSAYARELEFVD